MILSSGIMTAYVMNYWPCARYADNVSKIGNELMFIAMLANCVYLKEMSNSVSNFSPSASPAQAGQGAGNFMIFLTCFSLVYHSGKLIQNTVQAVRELYLRRQQIAGKLLGPPTDNDPDYSDDSSSGSEDEAYVDPDDGPSMDRLKLPKNEPKEDRKITGQEIHMLQFPKEVDDGMNVLPKVKPEENLIPKPETEESSVDEEIDVKSTLDIDVAMPFLYQANIAEPEYPFDENSWPKADKDCLPGQPGQSNDMGISLPEIPESVPGEP